MTPYSRMAHVAFYPSSLCFLGPFSFLFIFGIPRSHWILVWFPFFFGPALFWILRYFFAASEIGFKRNSSAFTPPISAYAACLSWQLPDQRK